MNYSGDGQQSQPLRCGTLYRTTNQRSCEVLKWAETGILIGADHEDYHATGEVPGQLRSKDLQPALQLEAGRSSSHANAVGWPPSATCKYQLGLCAEMMVIVASLRSSSVSPCLNRWEISAPRGL